VEDKKIKEVWELKIKESRILACFAVVVENRESRWFMA
jgi:hypothetical protein